LLHTKADLSSVDHLLESKVQENANNVPKDSEDMDNLKEALNSKVNRDELRRMKRTLQKELDRALKEVSLFTHPENVMNEGPALATRAHYRCLACDRIIFRINTKPMNVYGSDKSPYSEKSLPPMWGYDLAPNVAWRRSQVRDLLNSSKHSPNANSLASVGVPSITSSPTKTPKSHRNLPPLGRPGSSPSVASTTRDKDNREKDNKDASSRVERETIVVSPTES